MATNYTGNATPTLNNAPANSWATDAEKRSHVGNTYLVTGSGGTAGNVYAFEKYPSAVVKEVPASGLPAEIVTITDGGENLPMTSAEVSLSPQQDLNGYESPWPGGGGKNKLPITATTQTVRGVTFTVGTDGKITTSGTATADINFVINQTTVLTSGTQYHIAGCASGGNGSNYYLRSTRGLVASAAIPSFGTTATATDDALYLFLHISNGINANGLVFTPMICLASETDATFSPYSNICPISGHSGAELKIGGTYPTAVNTYSVTFADQGTVYGGMYDWVSGKLTVTKAAKTLDGSETYNWHNSGVAYTAIPGGIITNATTQYQRFVLCDKLQSASWAERTTFENCCGMLYGASYVFIKPSGVANATEAKAWVAANNLQIVYELATPLEYTLSPQQIETLLGENNVWSDAGEISKLVYRSNQYVMAYDWFETWTMPKITRNNGNIIVLPYPQEYTPEIYDVDASTTGRNAAGTMIRDRVARKHKFNYKFPPLGQADATEILNAVQDSSFTLTTASPETGAKTNYRVYVGDRSLPVYWMPNHNQNSWLYETVTMNLIEM